jgi:hypothetical protein
MLISGGSELESLLPVLVSAVAAGVLSFAVLSESSVSQPVNCDELHFGPSIVILWPATEIVASLLQAILRSLCIVHWTADVYCAAFCSISVHGLTCLLDECVFLQKIKVANLKRQGRRRHTAFV